MQTGSIYGCANNGSAKLHLFYHPPCNDNNENENDINENENEINENENDINENNNAIGDEEWRTPGTTSTIVSDVNNPATSCVANMSPLTEDYSFNSPSVSTRLKELSTDKQPQSERPTLLERTTNRGSSTSSSGRHHAPIPANVSKRAVNRNSNIEVFFSLDENIAEGSYGEIWRGTELATGMQFAIKKINKVQSHGSMQKQKELMNEYMLGSSMNHNNIVKVHQVFDDKTNTYIVMEICTGLDLFHFIEKAQPVGDEPAIDEDLCAHLMRQMISSIEHCHLRGVAHRDIKPENFLFERNVRDSLLKLVDFGLGIKAPKNKKNKWIKAPITGSHHYISPEVVAYHGAQYNEKCDMWSLGMVMFIMLHKDLPTNMIGGDTSGFDYNVMRKVPRYLPDMFIIEDSEGVIGCPRYSSDKENSPISLTNNRSFTRKRISSKCFCFLSSLLTLNPDERMSARQALDHSWLIEHDPTAIECCGSMIYSMSNLSYDGTTGSNLHLRSSRTNILRELTPASTCTESAQQNQSIPVAPTTASGPPMFDSISRSNSTSSFTASNSVNGIVIKSQQAILTPPLSVDDPMIGTSADNKDRSTNSNHNSNTSFNNESGGNTATTISTASTVKSTGEAKTMMITGNSISSNGQQQSVANNSSLMESVLMPEFKNMTTILTEEIYNLWSEGWLRLDPLQRALRGLYARTVLSYIKILSEHDLAIVNRWMSIFRILDAIGSGNLTKSGFEIALRTLVNGSKIYEEYSNNTGRVRNGVLNNGGEVVSTVGAGELGELIYNDETGALISRNLSNDKSMKSWGYNLREVDDGLSDESMVSVDTSGRNSYSESIFNDKASKTTNSKSTINNINESERPSSASSSPHVIAAETCGCVDNRDSSNGLGHLGYSQGALEMENDTYKGISKMLKLFDYVDIEARGVLEPHIFLASVFENELLYNDTLTAQLYQHMAGGKSLTVETLRHNLDWNILKPSTILGFSQDQSLCFWPQEQCSDISSDELSDIQCRIKRLFKTHGFCHSGSENTIGDNSQVITFEAFQAGIRSANVHPL